MAFPKFFEHNQRFVNRQSPEILKVFLPYKENWQRDWRSWNQDWTSANRFAQWQWSFLDQLDQIFLSSYHMHMFGCMCNCIFFTHRLIVNAKPLVPWSAFVTMCNHRSRRSLLQSKIQDNETFKSFGPSKDCASICFVCNCLGCRSYCSIYKLKTNKCAMFHLIQT